MFKPKEPTMAYAVVGVMKMDSGYQVSLSKYGETAIQFCIEDEDDVLKLMKEVLTGEFNYVEEKEDPVSLIH